MIVQIWRHKLYGWLKAVKLEDDGTVFDVQKVNEQKAQSIMGAGDFDAFADSETCRLLEIRRGEYEVIAGRPKGEQGE